MSTWRYLWVVEVEAPLGGWRAMKKAHYDQFSAQLEADEWKNSGHKARVVRYIPAE